VQQAKTTKEGRTLPAVISRAVNPRSPANGDGRAAEIAAEFLFQVIAELPKKAAVIMTANLPFSEWAQVIPNARICKALLDRITDRAHILETGTESYQFRRTAESGTGRRKRRKATTVSCGNVGIPPPVRDFQGRWEKWETCSWLE
jgi:hypothetical protein